MARVSVLMAVCNAAPWLRQAVDSVLGQTLQDVELLAVDDASTDDSLGILEDYAARDRRVRVMRNATNQGQAVARNVALAQATGEYVCMLDADDWLSPDALEKATQAFTDARVGCVVLDLVYEDGDGQRRHPRPQRDTMTGEEAFRLSLDWTLHGLYVVRRDLHQRYPYDTSERLYSDDNTTRLHYLHSQLVRVCDGEYHYRQHAASTTQAFSARRFLHMRANLSMRDTLLKEGVGEDIIRDYDRVRWNNYRGMMRLYYKHCKELTPDERRTVWSDFRRIYRTFSRSMPYALFALRERISAACAF